MDTKITKGVDFSTPSCFGVEDGIRTHDLLSPINQPLSYIVLSDVCIFVCTNKDTN